MAPLADFSRASALGFQQGQEMAGENPLGTFIRGMLADYKQKKAMEQEYGMKKGLIGAETEAYKAKETYKQGLEESSPLYKAQTKAYGALENQRTEGLIDEKIKKEAWDKYQQGDRSPETLKTLGKWVSPMEVMFANSMGFGGGGIDNTNIPQNKSAIGKPPKYNAKTQKLQYNQKTGEWRVVPK